jgi:hypothetical protein
MTDDKLKKLCYKYRYNTKFFMRAFWEERAETGTRCVPVHSVLEDNEYG